MFRVAFVKLNPRFRIYKQALALKKTGQCKLILIAQRYDKKLFVNVFDEIIEFGFLPKFNFRGRGRLASFLNKMVGFNPNGMGLAKTVREIKPDLFHVHAEPNTIPKIVMRNALVPVIFDAYDFTGISIGIENLDKRTLENEKYCLENAEAIIRKGPQFEIDYYKNHGYKIDCPIFQWLDYCNEEFFTNGSIKKLSSEDKEIHLVFTGSISHTPKYRYKYFIPLAKLLAQQRIHFHIYPDQWKRVIFKEYFTLDKKEKYFHFHEPVSCKKLSQEIAKYDYGCWIHPKPFGPRMTPEKAKVSIGNKLFSYLEAGLPIIVSHHLEYGREFIEKHRIGFSIKDSEFGKFREILKNCNYNKVQNNVFEVRKEFSLSQKVEDLVNFYKRVLKS